METINPPIKVNIVRYDLDISTKQGREAYKRINEDAMILGHKVMCALAGPAYEAKQFHDRIPDVCTIETDFIFADQYNTVEGFRIHDWYETYNPHNRQSKEGYYITGDDLPRLIALKQSRHSCGYCGKQYDSSELPPDMICTKCLTSEYLEESNLPLLVLVPIADSDRRQNLEASPELIARFHAAKPALLERLEKERIIRLNKKADRLIIDRQEKINSLTYETDMQVKLLRLGIDTSNLIYYSHTHTWCFGYSKTMTPDECTAMKAKLNDHKDVLGDSFINEVTFK